MEFARTLLAFLSMAAASASLSAGSLVKNGDFSALDANGFPSSWSFAANRDEKVSARLIKGGGPDGSNAVKIVNRSPREPHVYGTLSQKVFVPKGSKCEVSFSLKGKNAAGVSFTYGKKWDGRFQCKEISSDWREFSYSFAPPDEDFEADGGLAIRFIFEDLAEELLLSSVKLEALNTLSSVKSPSELYVLRKSPGFNPEDFSMPSSLRTLRFPLSAAQCFHMDGMPSAADLSCEAAAEYDAEGLIFHIKVRDDNLAPSPGEMLWQGDSIQLRIDQHGSLGPEDPSDVEIGVGLFSGKPQSWSWTLGRELNSNELDCAIAQTGDGYFANLRLKWELLKDFDPAKGAFSFNMVVNDNDGSGRKAIFLAQGIHISKSSKSNCIGLLEGKAQAFINASAGDKLMDFDGKSLFLAPNAPKSPLSLQVSDKAGRTASQSIAASKSLFDEEPASAKLSLDLAKLAAGPLDAKLVSGSSVLWSAKLLKSDIVKDAQQALSSASERYAALCKEFDSKKLKSWRADAIRAIFERQAPLLAKELETDSEPEEIAYYAKRGMRICGELGYLCDELKVELDKAAAGQAQLPVYKFLSTERRLSGGFFEAMMAGPDGKAVSRPVVFTGYGHFGQAQRDLPYFPALQANSIQMEFGPSRMVNGEKPDGSFIIDLKYVQSLMDKALSSASENGSTVCVLLSPHYFPGWALKAHPEVAEESGFLKYKFAHPYAKRLIEAYLRTAIPFLKSSKWASSIHSL